MSAREKITDRVFDGVDKWLQNDPLKVMARNDPFELAEKSRRHKIKAGVYLGGVALGGALIGETDGAAHVGAIAGTVGSGFAFWGNAVKYALFKSGPSEEQLKNIRAAKGPDYGQPRDQEKAVENRIYSAVDEYSHERLGRGEPPLGAELQKLAKQAVEESRRQQNEQELS